MKYNVFTLFFALALLTGCSLTGQDKLRVLQYKCGITPVMVGINEQVVPQQVTMTLNGVQHILEQTISASGARYSNGEYVFWSKGNSAFIERNGNVIYEYCQLEQ